MLNVKSTSIQPDGKFKVNYKGDSITDTYATGHFFLDASKYEDLTFNDLNKLAYTKIKEDFKNKTFNITKTNEESDGRFNISFNAKGENSSYISGNFVIQENTYRNTAFSQLREMAYTKLIEDFKR